MNVEERAKKWTQDIPELQNLTLEQRMMICDRVAKKLILILGLWGLLVIVAYFVILMKADQSSVIYRMVNDGAEAVNRSFNNSHAKRRMTALIESLPYILPQLLIVIVPMVVIFKVFRKPMLISAAKKL